MKVHVLDASHEVSSKPPTKGGIRRKLAVGLALAAAVIAPLGVFAGSTVNGPMAFNPIAGSAYAPAQTAAWGEEPFLIPEGYRQYRVSDESADLGGGPGLNIYAGAVDDLTDMNTTNETGKWAGRFLYRTHEVGSNGSLSVIDLQTGETKLLAQDAGWRRLDGIRWTPWGSILFPEETTGGRLFELTLDKNDPTEAAAVVAHPEVGILRHEGIEVGPDGSVYVIDELNGGSLYRFVPFRRGDLSDGQLYALRIKGISNADQSYAAYLADPDGNPHTGDFEWVPLDMNQVVIDADAASNAVFATEYGRPEDLEGMGQILYVANTSENRVLAIDLQKMTVSTFVQSGLNVPVEDAATGTTGFDSPDNLAEGPDGRLWIVEDNVPSDIWVTDSDKNKDGAADNVYLFASLRDPGAEGTGIYFGKDSHTLFVNIQHATKALADGTWAITNR
jgi:sugar lactone lactonase YvrE